MEIVMILSQDSSQSSGCAGRLGTHLASLTYARMSAAKLTGLAGAQFAIRTSIRNHAILKRDFVIKQVANAVGSPHTVDLTQYETLILVEVYKVSAPPRSAESRDVSGGWALDGQANRVRRGSVLLEHVRNGRRGQRLRPTQALQPSRNS